MNLFEKLVQMSRCMHVSHKVTKISLKIQLLLVYFNYKEKSIKEGYAETYPYHV